MAQGVLFNLQHFSIHDGPGIRTTVFFKGCNLHCPWCHNPESWLLQPQLQFTAMRCIGCGACVQACGQGSLVKTARFTEQCTLCGRCVDECYAEALEMVGRSYTIEEVMTDILRDESYYASSGGGITCSGGEPLLQPQFLCELLTACKERMLHTAVETALCVDNAVLAPLLPLVDLFMCDIKTMDDALHTAVIGQSNGRILQNLRCLSENGRQLLLRTPVIPGFNDTEDAIVAIADFIASLPGRHALELLPFRDLCTSKYAALNRPFGAAGLKTPEDAQMEQLAAAARARGIDCTVQTSFA